MGVPIQAGHLEGTAMHPTENLEVTTDGHGGVHGAAEAPKSFCVYLEQLLCGALLGWGYQAGLGCLGL